VTTPTARPNDSSTGPARSGLVLAALILVATVANLNLSVANVALPEIAIHFDAGQIGINLVAVGYSLGWQPLCCGSVPLAIGTGAETCC
jgi:hypothetical protein